MFPFVITNNSQFAYEYNFSNNSWTQIGVNTPTGTLTCCNITANGFKLALVATNNYSYLYDVKIGGAPTCTGAGVAQIAQLANGNEYRTGTDLSLWFFNSTAPFSYTYIRGNVVGVYASDIGNVYFVDNMGNLYSLNSSNVETLFACVALTVICTFSNFNLYLSSYTNYKYYLIQSTCFFSVYTSSKKIFRSLNYARFFHRLTKKITLHIWLI